jgi:hypothetical protein
MRRLLWVTPLLFVLISSAAWADTVNIFLAPNEGLGDNFGIQQQSKGMTVVLSGGTQTGFFDDTQYPPGSTFGGPCTVYLDYGAVEIGGVTYELNVGAATLNMSNFTLPTNGASSATYQVVLSFTGSGTIAETGQVINVSGSSTGNITFVKAYTGNYSPEAFAPGPGTVPEPGTLGLIGTGLIAVFSVARRRLRISTQPSQPESCQAEPSQRYRDFPPTTQP